jgi:hypothetical protein
MGKKLVILLALLFLLQLTEAASKYKKGGSFSARRRDTDGFSSRKKDSDGFGSFFRSSKKDYDSYVRKTINNDDDVYYKSSKRYNSRTNYYAGKKME